MNKSYFYEEYILSKENVIISENDILIELIFNKKLNMNDKLILKNNFDKIDNNNYLVKSELIKYNNDNKNLYSATFYNKYMKKENDIFDSKLIFLLFCEMTTTNLSETICGFKDLYSNSITIKLWGNINLGITTSYIVNKDEYDFVIVGGGPSGIYTAYKIGIQNPNSRILLLESNSKTLEEYKLYIEDYTKKSNYPDISK